MGDYYFAGMGTDQPQFQRAAACYQSATMTRTSAMALWNLGWMHEHGKGVAQVSFESLDRLIRRFETDCTESFTLGLSSGETVL